MKLKGEENELKVYTFKENADISELRIDKHCIHKGNFFSIDDSYYQYFANSFREDSRETELGSISAITGVLPANFKNEIKIIDKNNNEVPLPQGLKLEFEFLNDEKSCSIKVVSGHDGSLTDEEIDFLCNASFKYITPNNEEYIFWQDSITLMK